MPSPQEVAALRKNVLGAFDDYSRLTTLGKFGEQFSEVKALGSRFTIEDKGAVVLMTMLNEFFSVAPEKAVYDTALRRVNVFVDREARSGGRAWTLIRGHLLDIGREHGWSSADTLWKDWTPKQQKDFSDMVRRETGKQSGGCYIATAVYGSYDCPDVWVLRRFRDQQLMGSVLGRTLVRAYYATSPFAVRHGGPALRGIARRPLDLVVRVLRAQGVSAAPYDDLASRCPR